MAILDLLEKKKSETIDPCMNELTSGGMKIIEAAELILSRVSNEQLKAINPCMNELTSGGMKILEAAELIMSRVPLNLLQNINKELMDEIMGIDEQKDKINDAYAKKGV